MRQLRIRNRGPVHARLSVQGSKNSSLPCLAAALLHPGTTVLDGVPLIDDVMAAIAILRSLGADVQVEGNRVTICAQTIDSTEIPAVFMSRMRSSVIFLGALLARKKEAAAVSPGGCVLGERPIDFHLEGFRQLGCQVECREHQPVRITTTGMQAASIRLPFPSVGATENILLAASGAEGTTLIENAAKEPEILELSRFLEQMGFQIHGAGTSRISIRGKSGTRDVRFRLSGDRIVAGTWLLCCMSAGGSICLDQAPVSWMGALLHTLKQMGAEIWTEGNLVACTAPKKILPIASLETAPYPGFPTDMQSQLLPVLCRAEGESLVHEHIFSSRFRVAEELNRMGADIRVSKDQSCARIAGNALLHGASVTAPDLRGGAALIIAAMGAQGDTIIDDFYHVERGYECITDMIGILGGETCWIDKRDIK